MKTVNVDREFDASPQRVRSVFGDPAAYFDAIGFDIERDDDHLELTKRVAMATVTLDVKIHSAGETALAYNQVAGPFKSMTAEYSVNPVGTGSMVQMETTFESPAVGLGAMLNSATIRRQRRTELDVVEELLASTGEPPTTDTREETLGVEGD